MKHLVRIYKTSSETCAPKLVAKLATIEDGVAAAEVARRMAERTDQDIIRGVRYSGLETTVYRSSELKRYVTIPE